MSFSKNRKSSPPPYSAYQDSAPIRMEPVQHLSNECHIPVTIKQVDLDGYDMVPPVPTHYNTLKIPTWCDYTGLNRNIAKVVETRYGLPSRQSEAKRDFYFTVSMCYRLKTVDGEEEGTDQSVRITEQNWRVLGGLLHCRKLEVAGLSVRWWKKTTAQKKADRNGEGGGVGCCSVM